MAEALVTKRLHVSGLTPAITEADIERRLSAFGTVKATDGFGACDALGDPRKFAYVTIEATPKDLAKCLNVLSGSTWKGTKLRIGEAKLDFRERIAHINALPPPPPRQKRHHARNHGHPSSTLPSTPLSSADAAKTPGWTVTPSGRVVRPMKMRPARPLEPMRALVSELKSKFAGKKDGKVKKRVKPPPVRARRRTIDPTKWDSTYLTGIFLDAIPAPSSSHTREVAATVLDVIESESGEDENGSAHGSTMEVDVPSSPEQTPAAAPPVSTLGDIFAPREEESSFSLLGHLGLDLELEEDVLALAPSVPAAPPSHQPVPQSIPTSTQHAHVPTTTKHHRSQLVTLDSSRPLLFPLPESLPYPLIRSPSATRRNARVPCILFSNPNHRPSQTMNALPPSSAFTRPPDATTESIREQWDRDKAALTHEWKKAWREARGGRRGRRGRSGGGGDE